MECGGLASGISSASVSGLSPKGAGGPGQGDWEMYPVSWQTQESGGQGPLRLGGRVGCCRLGQAPSKVALVMEWGLWEDGPWGETVHCHLGRGLRLELLAPQSLSSFSHLGCIPLELHYCQCLHPEVWALLQTSLRSPFFLYRGLCCSISLQLAKGIGQFSEIPLPNVEAAFWSMWVTYFRKWLEFRSPPPIFNFSQVAGRREI